MKKNKKSKFRHYKYKEESWRAKLRTWHFIQYYVGNKGKRKKLPSEIISEKIKAIKKNILINRRKANLEAKRKKLKNVEKSSRVAPNIINPRVWNKKAKVRKPLKVKKTKEEYEEIRQKAIETRKANILSDMLGMQPTNKIIDIFGRTITLSKDRDTQIIEDYVNKMVDKGKDENEIYILLRQYGLVK